PEQDYHTGVGSGRKVAAFGREGQSSNFDRRESDKSVARPVCLQLVPQVKSAISVDRRQALAIAVQGDDGGLLRHFGERLGLLVLQFPQVEPTVSTGDERSLRIGQKDLAAVTRGEGRLARRIRGDVPGTHGFIGARENQGLTIL